MTAACSAARALARKLAEEKQAAINAARLAAEQSMDEEEIEALKVCMRVHLCKSHLHVATQKVLPLTGAALHFWQLTGAVSDNTTSSQRLTPVRRDV